MEPAQNTFALRRLAHILPGEDKEVADSAVEFLVEQSLLQSTTYQKKKQILGTIKQLFRMEFSGTEITSALNNLSQKGKVKQNHENRFILDAERRSELEKLNSSTEECENKIFSEWVDSLAVKYPELSSEDQAALKDDLRLYISQLFLKHGAECSVLIYPSSGKVANLVNHYSEERLQEILPSRTTELSKIRKVELPLFLTSLTPEKRKYFSQLLDATFIYCVLHADPDTRKLVANSFKNYILYLDTNILYALFNLHNDHQASAVEKVINQVQELGVRILVSTETINEMRTSVEKKAEELLNSRPIRREYAELAANFSSEDSIVTAYWRTYYRTGISKEDFLERFKHIGELVQAKGIPVEKTTQFKTSTLNDEIALLKEAVPSKSGHVAEHDAYHKLLIEQKRTDAERRNKIRKFWFFTTDDQLTAYDKATRKKGAPPFMIFPHQLGQVVRPFVKRTDDYNATFLELFSRPQIKSAQGVLPNDLTEKIISKISAFEDLPAEVAFNIIMDSKFKELTSKDIEESAKDAQIRERIESHLVAEVRKLKLQIEEIEAKQNSQLTIPTVEIREKQTELPEPSRANDFYQNLAFGIAIIFFLL